MIHMKGRYVISDDALKTLDQCLVVAQKFEETLLRVTNKFFKAKREYYIQTLINITVHRGEDSEEDRERIETVFTATSRL